MFFFLVGRDEHVGCWVGLLTFVTIVIVCGYNCHVPYGTYIWTDL